MRSPLYSDIFMCAFLFCAAGELLRLLRLRQCIKDRVEIAVHDIIEVAHSKGIKVILWFEYGFMHGIGGVKKNDPVLAKHPDWIAASA